MSDNLSVDALWQMADDLECWFPSHNMARFANAMRDVSKERDWLRAEVERLTLALADERRHADALADTLYSMDGLQKIDCEMRDNAVQQHRARRQG